MLSEVPDDNSKVSPEKKAEILKKLELFKKEMATTKDFSKTWDFFLDNFGYSDDFQNMGVSCKCDFVEVAIETFCKQVYKQRPPKSDYKLFIIPGGNFIHGLVGLPPRLVNIIFNGDTGVSIICGFNPNGQEETKFTRLTPHQITPQQAERLRNTPNN